MTKITQNTTKKQQDTRGIVNIHGKDYMTVARRVEIAHADNVFEELYTEILSNEPVIIRATVTIKGKKFTGISSVQSNSGKMIEKQNPYEVAETSAVGRALGFAGFGIVEGIASADEMHKSGVTNSTGSGRADVAEHVESRTSRQVGEQAGWTDTEIKDVEATCADCGARITDKVSAYSSRRYGRPLCFNCQKEASQV